MRVGAGVPTPMPPLTPRATVGKALPDVPQRPGVAVAKPGGSPRDVQAQLDELNRGMQEIRSMLGALTQQRQAEARIGWTAAAAAEIAEASAKGLGPRHPDVVKAKESAIADMKALPPVSTPLPELRIELEMAQDELRELETSGGGSAITEPVRNAAKRRVERLARLIEYRQKLSDYEQESRNRTAADAEKAAAERYALVAETIALQKQILELEHMLKGAVGEKAEEIQTKLLNARMKLIEGEVRLKEMPRKD